VSNHKDLQKLLAPGPPVNLGTTYRGTGTLVSWMPTLQILKNFVNKLCAHYTLVMNNVLYICAQLKRISLPEERNFGADLNLVII
jgi:hypothetical protein